MNKLLVRFASSFAAVLVAASCTALPDLDDADGDKAPSPPPSPAAPEEAVSALIGPSGGELRLPRGVTLRVPAGALLSPTEISAAPDARPPSLARESVLLSIEFHPHGLEFRIPAALVVPDSAMRAPSAEAARLPRFFFSPQHEIIEVPAEDVDPAQHLPLSMRREGEASIVTLHHFSHVASTEPRSRKVKALDSRDTATADTLGLSAQIFGQLNEGIERFDSASAQGLTSSDPYGIKLLPNAARDLELAAIDAARKVHSIHVAYTWRSVATQYVIWNTQNTGANTSADVGRGRHGMGAAIDIDIPANSPKKCRKALAEKGLVDGGVLDDAARKAAMEIIAPVVGQALSDHHWKWYGLNENKSVCDDPVHFEWDQAAANDSSGVVAFQQLWNRHNPCFPIKEDGIVDPATRHAIGNAPSQGWDPAVEISPNTKKLSLPFEGAGCGLDPVIGPPAPSPPPETVCCPSRNPSEPTKAYCAKRVAQQPVAESCGCTDEERAVLIPQIVGSWSVRNTESGTVYPMTLAADGTGEYLVNGSKYPTSWRLESYNKPLPSYWSTTSSPKHPLGVAPACIMFDTGFWHPGYDGVLRSSIQNPVTGFSKYNLGGPYGWPKNYFDYDLSKESRSLVYTKQ